MSSTTTGDAVFYRHMIPYEDLILTPVEPSPRAAAGDYVRPQITDQMFVPAVHPGNGGAALTEARALL